MANQRKLHSLEVEAVSPGQIFAEYKLHAVDFLKISYEGAKRD